jgi:predicted transcriptional regulator
MGKDPRAEPHLTDAEWKVMNAVWARGEATPRHVLEALRAETRWAYTTVKTLMDRLVEKGALRARRSGLTSLYRPVLAQARARRGAVRALAERVFGGALGPLVHCLVDEGTLSPRQRRELRRLLADQDRAEAGS